MENTFLSINTTGDSYFYHMFEHIKSTKAQCIWTIRSIEWRMVTKLNKGAECYDNSVTGSFTRQTARSMYHHRAPCYLYSIVSPWYIYMLKGYSITKSLTLSVTIFFRKSKLMIWNVFVNLFCMEMAHLLYDLSNKNSSKEWNWVIQDFVNQTSIFLSHQN